VTKILSLAFANMATLKLELSMSFCSTNRPLKLCHAVNSRNQGRLWYPEGF
jgi:hypothetical protein